MHRCLKFWIPTYYRHDKRWVSLLQGRKHNVLNAEKLSSAPDLQELVLHAPDAGLAAMPKLRNATFIEVYMMGSLFGNCTALNHLALEGGELKAIPDHWLAGCSGLKSLKVIRLGNLVMLPGDMLEDTTELRLPDLSYNSLVNLPEGLFDSTRRLEHLDVSHNRLSTLPGDLPDSLSRVSACGNVQETLTIYRQDSRDGFYLADSDCVHIT